MIYLVLFTFTVVNLKKRPTTAIVSHATLARAPFIVIVFCYLFAPLSMAVCPNLFTFGRGPCHTIKVKICHGQIRL